MKRIILILIILISEFAIGQNAAEHDNGVAVTGDAVVSGKVVTSSLVEFSDGTGFLEEDGGSLIVVHEEELGLQLFGINTSVRLRDGIIMLRTANLGDARLNTNLLSMDRNYQFPDDSGIFVLTSTFLGEFTEALSTVTTDSLLEGNTNLYFPGFTTLLSDYGFIDNSANWDIAYTHSQSSHAPANAEQNVQSDWNAVSGDAFILNKPIISAGLDWTVDQGATNIHPNNYINTTYSNLSEFNNDVGYITSQTDSQTLSWVNNTRALSISGGNTVTIPDGIDWTVDQGATNIHPNNYINTTYTNVSEFTNDAGYITSQTDSQTLSWVDGTRVLSISGGNSVTIPAATVSPTTPIIQKIKVTLTSAQILNLAFVPVEIVPAPGAGKIIHVISYTTRLNFNTTAYATNVNLGIRYDAQVATIQNYNNILSQTATHIVTGSVNNGVPAAENSGIEALVNVGNPTDGDSTVDVYLTYEIIDL